MDEPSDFIRNFGIIAHIDAGKTTLTERILHETGQLRVCGAVEDGTTVSDYLLQERERGISIVSAAVTCPWRGYQLTLLDTPGHIDFTAEVERSLRVMDSAIAVFCAVRGVQAQSEMVWRRAAGYGLPGLAFVSKLDREGADFEGVLAQMGRLFGKTRPLPLARPITDPRGRLLGILNLLTGELYGPADETPPEEDVELALWDGRRILLETLAECQDSLLEDYLAGRFPDRGALDMAIRQATLKNQVIPVLCGSSKEGWGVRTLLDAVVSYLPSPAERMSSPWGRRTFPALGESFLSPKGRPYAVMTAVKLVRSPWPGDYLAVRLYSGTVEAGMLLRDANRELSWRVGRVWRLRASDAEEIPSASSGEVVGLAATPEEPLPAIRAGDTLLEDGAPVLRLAKMKFPEPVLSLVLEGVDADDRKNLPKALEALAEEDPTIRWKNGPRDGQCTASGLGELHLQVVRERLKSEYCVKTRAGAPMVAYRTTVASKCRLEREFRRQLSPALTVQARVEVEFEPLPPNSGAVVEFPFRESTTLPLECCEAIQQATTEFVDGGNPTGYPLTNTRITVLEVSSVSPDTSEPVFLTATRLALVDSLEEAGEVVMEPVMRLEVSSPAEQIGSILNDLSARRARVLQVDALPGGGSRAVALVPMVEIVSYATALRSISAGRALFTAEPAALEKRPGQDK